MNHSNSTSKIQIRSIDINDYSALKGFANDLLTEQIHLSVNDSKLTTFLSDGDQVMLVAEINNEIIGVISAGKLSGLSESSRWVELFVDVNWRRKCIGKSLLRALMSLCRDNTKIQSLVLSVSRTNKPAVALYLKSGFIKRKTFTSLLSPVINMHISI